MEFFWSLLLIIMYDLGVYYQYLEFVVVLMKLLYKYYRILSQLYLNMEDFIYIRVFFIIYKYVSKIHIEINKHKERTQAENTKKVHIVSTKSTTTK
jgi:hypothetical protein